MATNNMRRRSYLLNVALLAVALLHGSAWAHENALNCNSVAAKQPSIEGARAELQQKPKSVSVRMSLSDLLVGIGCYDEAVHVLEDGVKLYPSDRSLHTRLRTARSFIGEQQYLDKQPAVSGASNAAFLRAELRCKQIGDILACDEAVAMRPNDAALWAAKGDALLKDKRSEEALLAFTRASQANASVAPSAQVDVTARVSAAKALLAMQSPTVVEGKPASPVAVPVAQATVRTANAKLQVARTYSNVEPASRSN